MRTLLLLLLAFATPFLVGFVLFFALNSPSQEIETVQECTTLHYTWRGGRAHTFDYCHDELSNYTQTQQKVIEQWKEESGSL